MIAVHVARDRAERRAAVLRQIQRSRKREHAIRVLWIDANIGVIEGAKVDVRIAIYHAPVIAGIVRAPELTLVLCLADDIHDAWIARRDGDADAIHVGLRQPAVPILS